MKSISGHYCETDNDAASEPIKRDELDEAELDYEADEVGGHDEKPLSDDDDLVTGKGDGENAGEDANAQVEKQVRVLKKLVLFLIFKRPMNLIKTLYETNFSGKQNRTPDLYVCIKSACTPAPLQNDTKNDSIF